jgi:hypothetical protein
MEATALVGVLQLMMAASAAVSICYPIRMPNPGHNGMAAAKTVSAPVRPVQEDGCQVVLNPYLTDATCCAAATLPTSSCCFFRIGY